MKYSKKIFKYEIFLQEQWLALLFFCRSACHNKRKKIQGHNKRKKIQAHHFSAHKQNFRVPFHNRMIKSKKKNHSAGHARYKASILFKYQTPNIKSNLGSTFT